MKSAGKQAVGDRRGILDTDEKRGKKKQPATGAVYLIPMKSAGKPKKE